MAPAVSSLFTSATRLSKFVIDPFPPFASDFLSNPTKDALAPYISEPELILNFEVKLDEGGGLERSDSSI